MYEIELKAHVDDRAAVIHALNSFADYMGSVEKSDTYYKLISDGKKITARIRRESVSEPPKAAKNADESDRRRDELPCREKQRVFLTYKRKELRTDANGTACEVNDEKECEVSDADALEALLTDIGFTVSLTKQKSVMGWMFEDAHLELCAVPPLGDFLEIEIISPSNGQEIVEGCQEKLKKLLDMARVPRDNIEERYYSDMLREARQEFL